MRAVVTIVVSKAEMNRQSHKPAIIVCNLAWPMLGTTDAAVASAGLAPIVIFSLSTMVVVVPEQDAPRIPHSQRKIDTGRWLTR
jgi:hypothetical protein